MPLGSSSPNLKLQQRMQNWLMDRSRMFLIENLVRVNRLRGQGCNQLQRPQGLTN